MLATVLSAAVNGLDGTCVSVEVDLQRGLRCFNIVGLPNLAVRESRERVVSALLNAGYAFPERRVTVNLAPADVPKEGAAFDLAIALGILSASKQIAARDLEGRCVLGELALDGSLRATRGVLPIAIAMQRLGVRGFVVPEANVAEARLVPGLVVVGADSLREAVEALCPTKRAAESSSRVNRKAKAVARHTQSRSTIPASTRGAPAVRLVASPHEPTFSQVYGQELAKRALAVAAAGGHHVLMVGPPGVGKSLLARCLPGLLPPLSAQEALETRQVLSVCGLHEEAAAASLRRPFRAPHHTVTVPALVGGGRPVIPGEITRAQHGVLFLDELPEFSRGLLDLLRQPLEEGVIRLARANQQIRFPARFQLVAAMNPCPCGFLGHPKKPCHCTPGEVQRYRSRISGPILDRIDLRIELGVPPAERIGVVDANGAPPQLGERVATARARQARRYGDLDGVHCNAQLGPEARRKLRARREAIELLRRAMKRWNLSVRAFERTLTVARSIADLEGASDINVQHVGEALQYRVEPRTS